MIGVFRAAIGIALMRWGLSILPRGHKEACALLLCDVPGALSEKQKAEVRAAAKVWFGSA